MAAARSREAMELVRGGIMHYDYTFITQAMKQKRIYRLRFLVFHLKQPFAERIT